MKFKLYSSSFVFLRSEAWLVPADVDEAVRSSFDVQSLTSSEREGDVVAFNDSQSEGEFWLILSGLLVERKTDQIQARVPHFLVPEPASITLADLARGTLDIVVEPQGLFSVKLVNRELQALPRQAMRLAVGNVTTTVKADENGEILFLGDLASIMSAVDPSLGLCVVPM